jgi:predicted ribosomally synthesized peptide with nif11-like leader
VSEEGVTALLERLESDPSFREQLQAAPTAEAKRQIVRDAGLDVDRSDLPTVRSMAGLEELSDDDLEKVAGGGAATVAGTASAAAAVAVPAAAVAIAALA